MVFLWVLEGPKGTHNEGTPDAAPVGLLLALLGGRTGEGPERRQTSSTLDPEQRPCFDVTESVHETESSAGALSARWLSRNSALSGGGLSGLKGNKDVATQAS